MNILLFSIIILIILIIFIQTKKDIVYIDSPADPDYIIKLVTFTFFFKDAPEMLNTDEYCIEKIFYAHKKISNDYLCDYIYDNRYLYDDIRNRAILKFKENYKTDATINTVRIQIENI